MGEATKGGVTPAPGEAGGHRLSWRRAFLPRPAWNTEMMLLALTQALDFWPLAPAK